MDNLNLNNNMGWAMSSLALSDIVEEKVNDIDYENEHRNKPTEAQKEEAMNRFRDGDRSRDVLDVLDRSEM